jgi:multiple sugar transport system permease protein
MPDIPSPRPATHASFAGFVLPAGAAGLLLVVLPLLTIIALSLTDWNLSSGQAPHLTGLRNYARMLHDAAFWGSLGRTVLLAAESTALQIVLGVAIALLFNRDWPGMAAIRSLFLAPMMIAPVFVGMIWRLMLSDDFGIVKYGLQLAGVQDAPLWLDDPRIALQTIVIVSAWEWTAFVVLFALAGLQAIPAEIYEAASLDGCGAWRRFRSMTLPLLAPTLGAIALFRAIDGFKIFDLIYAMTAGGPGTSTTTMSYFIYQQGVNFFDLAYSSTLALVLLVLTILLCTPLLRRRAP